jgi:hypothetical protein
MSAGLTIVADTKFDGASPAPGLNFSFIEILHQLLKLSLTSSQAITENGKSVVLESVLDLLHRH